MNKKFFSKLTSYIDHCNKKLEEFNKTACDWEEMDEDQKIEAITRETEISVLKWVKDLYMESI